MDQSRKQFKALNMAQPIKKQINQTLTKLQLQKRKFLSLERQQISLKQQLQKARRQLNEVKILQPKTRVKQNKNIQTHMSINNTDRIYLNTVNKISQIKTKIDVHRKQIDKYKKLINQLQAQTHNLQSQNNSIESNLLKQQDKNQTIKAHLLDYRTLNMRNTDQFKNSFHALHRSSVKEQNQRKKIQMNKKNFNYEQLKNSNLVRLVDIQEEHAGSKIGQSSPRNDVYMTNCIPLVKERIRILIHNNKQKIKISQNYKKFGQQLQNMFSIMKEYKGRDDVGFIADQFVMKQKQLKKIQQYIGKLQNRLMQYQNQLQKIKHSDVQLIQELKSGQKQQGKVKQKNFIKLQNEVIKSIQQLKKEQQNNTQWFNKIGNMLSVLVDGEMINRGNIDKMLGVIEEKYLNDDKKKIVQVKDEKLNKSPTKAVVIPSIDQKQIKSTQSMQLMSYQKLKQYAKQYINVKK